MSLLVFFRAAGAPPAPTTPWPRWDAALVAGTEVRSGPERTFQINPSRGSLNRGGVTFDVGSAADAGGGTILTGDDYLAERLEALGFTEIQTPSRP